MADHTLTPLTDADSSVSVSNAPSLPVTSMKTGERSMRPPRGS